MFKKSQSTDKKHPIYISADSSKGQESNFHKRTDGESDEMVDLTNEESNEANKSVSLQPQVYINTKFVLVLQLTNKLYENNYKTMEVCAECLVFVLSFSCFLVE